MDAIEAIKDVVQSFCTLATGVLTNCCGVYETDLQLFYRVCDSAMVGLAVQVGPVLFVGPKWVLLPLTGRCCGEARRPESSGLPLRSSCVVISPNSRQQAASSNEQQAASNGSSSSSSSSISNSSTQNSSSRSKQQQATSGKMHDHTEHGRALNHPVPAQFQVKWVTITE